LHFIQDHLAVAAPSLLVILVDMWEWFKANMTGHELEIELCKALQTRLFPREKRQELLSWLLAGEPDPGEGFSPALLSDYYHRSQHWLAKYGLINVARRRDRQERLLDILKKHDEEYIAADRDVEGHLTAIQILQAFVSLTPKKDRVVVVLDNVDRLETNPASRLPLDSRV
jgi:hypothetical protein